MQDQKIDRPIYPGASDTFHISLRFGAADAPVETAGRRYLSSLCRRLSVHRELVRPPAHRHARAVQFRATSATNPRGWFQEKGSIHDRLGRARKSAQRLLQYADTSIKEMKRVGAQGMITWDIEGSNTRMPPAISATRARCPPRWSRSLTSISRSFTDAGFRVGITIRPQRPVRNVYKKMDKSGNNEEVEQESVADILYNMEQKIEYANKRWGCTLFYIDSNAKHDPYGSWSTMRRPIS